MNHSPLRVWNVLLTLVCGLLVSIQVHAQMKIGNHPTQIHPASILELESNNQALRLTQGDTLEVNGIIGNGDPANSHDLTQETVQAAEGMIMYNNADHSLYMRIGGYWRQMTSADEVDSTFWKLTGNAGTDPALNFLGTTDNAALKIGTNNSPYILISSTGMVNIVDSLQAGGFAHFTGDSAVFDNTVSIQDSLKVGNGQFVVGLDSIHAGKAFFLQDSLTLRTVRQALSTDDQVLVISPEGIVRKTSFNSLGIRTINGVGGTNLHLRLDTVSSGHTGPWIDSLTAKPDSTLILNLPDAALTIRGLMNDTLQSFGGLKSFQNSVAVGTADTATSTLQVTGTIGTGINIVPTATGNYDMATNANGEANYRTIIFDVSTTTGGVTVTLPDASQIPGRVYTFKKIGIANDGQINNPVQINTSAGQTIEGDGGSFTIYNNFTSVTLQAQNNEWYIIK